MQRRQLLSAVGLLLVSAPCFSAPQKIPSFSAAQWLRMVALLLKRAESNSADRAYTLSTPVDFPPGARNTLLSALASKGVRAWFINESPLTLTWTVNSLPNPRLTGPYTLYDASVYHFDIDSPQQSQATGLLPADQWFEVSLSLTSDILPSFNQNAVFVARATLR